MIFWSSLLFHIRNKSNYFDNDDRRSENLNSSLFDFKNEIFSKLHDDLPFNQIKFKENVSNQINLSESSEENFDDNSPAKKKRTNIISPLEAKQIHTLDNSQMQLSVKLLEDKLRNEFSSHFPFMKKEYFTMAKALQSINCSSYENAMSKGYYYNKMKSCFERLSSNFGEIEYNKEDDKNAYLDFGLTENNEDEIKAKPKAKKKRAYRTKL